MYDTRRIESARGYLEVISRDSCPIAYITDHYGGSIRNPIYLGVYGIHEVVGRTVCAVKEELFSLIESGR